MTQITIDTTQLDEFLKKFGAEAIPIVETKMRAALDESLEYLLALVADNTPVNYGMLRGSEYTEVRGVSADETRGVVLEGLVSSSDYEPKVTAMEYGRAIGKMPPIDAIALWVKRKGLATDEQEIRSIAFAIARAIGKGQAQHQRQPFAMFQTAFEKGGKQVEKTFDQATDEIIRGWSQL
jgi:hypothetical protein